MLLVLACGLGPLFLTRKRLEPDERREEGTDTVLLRKASIPAGRILGSQGSRISAFFILFTGQGLLGGQFLLLSIL
jgi:hypothetical protein